MRARRNRHIAIALAAAALTLTGCANQTVRDLEGVPIADPDKVKLVVNVDQFANVVALCIEGQGFVSTTRDNSPAALMHIPEWGEEGGWCAE